MRKIILFLVLFLFPLVVFAKDTCDSNSIEIQSIELEKSIGNIEEVSSASISNQKINLGLKMNVLGDAAEYKIVLKNNSLEDYYFDENTLNYNLDSVNYNVSFDDNMNLIKAREEKVVYLKVSYKDKVDASLFDNGLYNGTQVVELNVMNINNPYTGRFLGLLISISLIIGFFIFYKDKRGTAYLLLLISFIIPFTVKAVCKHSLEVNTNLVIDAREAIFLPGEEVNVKMKQLAGDDTSTSTYGHDFNDLLITSFQYSEVEPNESNKEEKNIVSIPESGYPIYMWFDNGTIYWWSEDKTPALNENASYMFAYLYNLEDIQGIRPFDVTLNKTLEMCFYHDSLLNLDIFSSWNTTKISNMSFVFAYNTKLISMDGIRNWDVSNVVNLSGVFTSCYSLEEIDLSQWKTSPELKSIYCMFGMLSNIGRGTTEGVLKRVILSENFNTSNVSEMRCLFIGDDEIEDYSFLRFIDPSKAVSLESVFFYNYQFDDKALQYIKDWNVSRIESFKYLFSGDNISSLDGLENWNVSNVKNFFAMVSGNLDLEDISAIKDWDVSNSNNFSYMFSGDTKITDVSVINDWDINKDADFTSMFKNLTVYPEFTKVPGTWNNGTFIPNE